MATNNAESSSASTDNGLAPAPLEQQGGDDFASLLSGGSESKSTTTESTQDLAKPAGTISKPAGKEGEKTGTVASPEGTTPAAPAATQSGLDPKLIEDIVAASTRGVQKATAESASATAQQKKDARQMSPEEFNAKYQIRSATVDDIKALLDQDPQKAVSALNELLVANTRTAVLMANDVFQAQLKQTRGEFEPHVKAWTAYQAQQKEQAMVTSFYTKYPDLTNEKELVQEMIDSLRAKRDSGAVSFSSEDQVFEAVAAASRKLLARMNTQAAGAGGKTASSTNTGQASSRQMASASTAGRSGTGQAAQKTDAELVFGADAR